MLALDPAQMLCMLHGMTALIAILGLALLLRSRALAFSAVGVALAIGLTLACHATPTQNAKRHAPDATLATPAQAEVFSLGDCEPRSVIEYGGREYIVFVCTSGAIVYVPAEPDLPA